MHGINPCIEFGASEEFGAGSSQILRVRGGRERSGIQTISTLRCEHHIVEYVSPVSWTLVGEKSVTNRWMTRQLFYALNSSSRVGGPPALEFAV